jgi:lipoprotein LprG
MRRRTLLAAATLAAVIPFTAACSGGDAKKADPKAELATAKQKFDEAKFVAFGLSSVNVPPKKNGVTGGEGAGEISATEPKFQGTVTGTVKGITGSVGMLAIGNDAYMKFFTSDYNKADLADLGAPNPATFFNPDKGISSLIPKTTDLKEGDRIREGKDILRQINGKLPGQPIKDLFFLGDGTGTFDVSYGLADNGELRTATLRGPFFTGLTSTYTLRLKDYGKPVVITRP